MKQMRELPYGAWDQAYKAGTFWGVNCVQPSESYKVNKVKLLLISLPQNRLAEVRGQES